MKKRAILVSLVIALLPAQLGAEAKIKVVTTLAAYADIAAKVGGDLIEARSIAAARFDPHYIEPRPSDVLRVKRADLFVHSGLDLEAWRDPLLDAAGRAEVRRGGSRELDLSLGIRLLEVPTGQLSRAEGDIHLYGNPHYWLNPENGLIIARALAAKLAQIDSAHAAAYAHNARVFCGILEKKIAAWRAALAPYAGRELVGHHDGWAYLVDFAGLRMPYYLEPKAGIPPTPRHLEKIISIVRERNLAGVVRASFDPPQGAEVIAEKTGARIAVLVSNPGEIAGVDEYVGMFDFNVRQLIGVLTRE